MKKDVQVHKDLFKHSEEKRYELQVHITETAVKVHEDTTAHGNYQTELIQENTQLKADIQELKQVQARKDQEHLKHVDDLNNKHKAKVDHLQKEHQDKQTEMANDHHLKYSRLQRESHEKFENMVKEKD